MSGEWSEAQCLKQFLDAFDPNPDGTLTFDEFVMYYSGVSASIDSDAYFDVMMRNSFKL
jgi:calcyphosin